MSVNKSEASDVLRVLRGLKLLDEEYKITRANSTILIPVKEVDKESLVRLLGEFSVVECNPPRRRGLVNTKMPSMDHLGKVVIVRRNILDYISADDLINRVKAVYPGVRAIWVKEETCDFYRKPVLRLLWGEEIREIVVKEYGLFFKVKLGDVYFNPRLAEEHHRVATITKHGEVVLDAFSGIGGFAIHTAALKQVLVFANDLNPVAYELLVENLCLNKRRLKGAVIPLNMDTRELVSALRESSVDRVIADLPHQSLEYAEIYEKLLKPRGVLHIYVLSRFNENIEQVILERFKGWCLEGCISVLEHSPGASIYRCDLLKV